MFVYKHMNLLKNLFIKDILNNDLYEEVLFRFILNESYPLKQYLCYKKCKCMLNSMSTVWNETNWTVLCELSPTKRKIFNEEAQKHIFSEKPTQLLHELKELMHNSLKRLENDVDYVLFENSLRLKSESIKIILEDIFDERRS